MSQSAPHSKQTPGTPGTPGADRAAFFAPIHAALGRSATRPPREPAPLVDESLARLAHASDDLPVLFTQRAQAVGMNVHRTRQQDAPALLAELLTVGSAKSVALSDALAATGPWRESLQRAGFTLIDWRGRAGVDRQFDTDAGVTDVQGALAESGTLVCTSGADTSRGLSLICPLHFAVLRASQIWPDMIDFWRSRVDRSAQGMPSSISFITGPSKTADIEGVLITGVHGPAAVHILLVEDA